MKAIFALYRNAYSGLSLSSWMLALVMFINRSGSMVVPFLSVYLTESLRFSVQQAGLILTAFGIGAMIGSLLGGWLSDRIGSFRVQFLSLTLGGSLFLMLANVTTFHGLLAGILLLSIVVECLRPANSASVAQYARPENITRSFSLNRMAVNLGFSIGPALGGLLASLSYYWLFIADGFTCLAAGLFFFLYFRHRHPRKSSAVTENAVPPSARQSPYRDGLFLAFLVFVTSYGIIFFQFFNTLPLYYREVYQLSESTIGLLLAFNGLLVFLFEMITVHKLENRVAAWKLAVIGTLLCGFSYVLLNLAHGRPMLLLAMLLLTFSEIFAMPFLISFTIKRAGESNRGSYIGLHSLAFSTAFILAPYLGTQLIAHFGYVALWYVAGMATIPTALGLFLTMRSSEASGQNA